MDFSTEFLNRTLLASVFALLWFGLPGIATMRLLGLTDHTFRLQNGFIAPALGLTIFGSYSFLIASIIGFNLPTLISSWLSALIILYFWRIYRPASNKFTGSLPPLHSLGLLGAAILWALLPTLLIYPFVHQEALFVSDKIFDHAKVAIVDAIVREGLPPLNPYYAPDGERILLLYYYLWHFLAAQLKLLLNISGWQAEVVMTGFTAFATLSFLIALANFCSQKRIIAAWLVILLAFLGTPVDLLLTALGHEWQHWIGYPLVNGAPTHTLELLWIQAAWVPQHLLSALAVVVLIFLISQVLLHAQIQTSHAIVAGFIASTAFGSSTWVGGIALSIALPALILAALSLHLPRQHYIAAVYSALLAIGIAGIVSIPLFISQMSGPAAPDSQLPFGLSVYPSTNLFAKDTTFGYTMHVLLFWLQFLPLNLGIAYLAGMFTLIFRKNTQREVRPFYALSFGAVLGFLLIVLFVKSTFWNNTFAWRAVLVPVMLLMVWAAVGIADFVDKATVQKNTWRLQRILHAGQPVIFALMIIWITIGLLATGRLYHLPNTHVSDTELAVHQGFLKQHAAWKKVREFVKPDELVQVNPDGYLTLTPWAATLPYALFADRSIAYANVEYATVFAYRYDPKQNQAAYELMKNIFSATPHLEAVRKLRDVFKVKAILVDKFDPVWSSDVIEKTGIYQIVHRDADIRIYLSHTD